MTSDRPTLLPRRILVAIDGSDTSLSAADQAMEFAAQIGAEITLIHVHDEEVARALKAAVPDKFEEAQWRLEDDADHLLEHLAERARKGGIPCTVRTQRGDPCGVINAVAEEVGADLIVVGRTGRRGVRRVLLGSVARRLIESSRVPVLVVTERAEEGAPAELLAPESGARREVPSSA
ncbi:MAG TPA: universal stress protein [Deltaproteobacteria bacterium]|jgi:nucleotide-binding universal stress UspA family protein|nr:universal stress protein [Deltaproteobacteria bacterium]